MLWIYCLQQWYGLSDPGVEEALYDMESIRRFAGLELGEDAIPDETTSILLRLTKRHIASFLKYFPEHRIVCLFTTYRNSGEIPFLSCRLCTNSTHLRLTCFLSNLLK